MKIIIATVIVAALLGLLLGVLLGLFKKVFAVKVDPKIEQIISFLSGGNCGGCGFAACCRFYLRRLQPSLLCLRQRG